MSSCSRRHAARSLLAAACAWAALALLGGAPGEAAAPHPAGPAAGAAAPGQPSAVVLGDAAARSPTPVPHPGAAAPGQPGAAPLSDTAALRQPGTAAPPDTAALRRRMEEVMEGAGIPGAGVALVTADSLLWLAGLGVAHRGADVPVDTTTAFRAGMAGVSVVGTVLMRLSEEGALALDDPVTERVPDVPVSNPWGGTSPLRLAHLVEHTGGLSEVSLGTLARRGEGPGLGPVLAGDPLVREVRWPPGQHRARTRAGPALAARAVEHLAGEPFEAVARGAVFDPLEMPVASYRGTGTAAERLAQGYRAGGEREVPYREVPLRAVEGLALTPRELGRFTRLFLGRGQVDGVRVLSPGAVEWMEEASTGLPRQAGLGADYGFGIDASVEEGFVFRGHAGRLDGFSAAWGYLPGPGVGYALMANTEGKEGFRGLESEVRRHLVEGVEPPEPESRAVLPPRRLEEMSGSWERITSPRDALDPLHRLVGILRVRVADDPDADLEVRPLGGDAGPWVATAGDRFRPVDEPVPRLGEQTDEAGRRLLVATGEDLEGTYAPVPGWGLWTRWLVTALVLLAALSAVGFAPLWLPRWWRGEMPEGERVSVRAIPAGASASLLGALLLLWVASGEAVARLGTVSAWSLGFLVLTLAFALLAVAGAFQAFRAREDWAPGPVRTHARLISVANLLALLYLAAFGLVGARLWLL